MCERGWLRQSGFTERAIYRLLQLRRTYAAEQAQREGLDTFRRLQFVRWLVRTGKLTEQISQALQEKYRHKEHEKGEAVR